MAPRDTLRFYCFCRRRVVEKLAQGGMGVIHRGHDSDLGRDVAVKVLREDRLTDGAVIGRFLEEAQIGSQLQHRRHSATSRARRRTMLPITYERPS